MPKHENYGDRPRNQNMTQTKKVVILQHRLLHYRSELFSRLRAKCDQIGISLALVHGQASQTEGERHDTATLDWADRVNNVYTRIGGRDLIWQPFPNKHLDAHLIILMQENRIISNYPWLFKPPNRRPRIAYWGHGRNLQSRAPNGIREAWKRRLSRRVDWWFAYTQSTKDILLDYGFPEERITVLNNSIDNEKFASDLRSAGKEESPTIRDALDLGRDTPHPNIGLFCGSLYPDKRIDILIASADLIRQTVPNFHLVIIGDGPNSKDVALAAQRRPWVHHIGAKTGLEKAAWYKNSRIILNPGSVGLHVLDSFYSGVPMLTLESSKHGPEISYIQNRINGLIVSGGAREFALAAVELISNERYYNTLSTAAAQSAQEYTLSNMVDRFCDGVLSSLTIDKYTH